MLGTDMMQLFCYDDVSPGNRKNIRHRSTVKSASTGLTWVSAANSMLASKRIGNNSAPKDTRSTTQYSPKLNQNGAYLDKRSASNDRIILVFFHDAKPTGVIPSIAATAVKLQSTLLPLRVPSSPMLATKGASARGRP